MKKLFTVIALTLCLSSTIAQDFKIKKGNIIIDNQTVAVIKKVKDRFIISEPSGDLLYHASIKNITPKGREISQKWIELVNKDNKIYETDLKLKGFNFNMTNRLVENLIEKGFLTTSGVDEHKYNTTNTNITDNLDSILDTFDSEYAIEDGMAKENYLKIGKASMGYHPITSDFVLIGYITGGSKYDPKDNSKVISEYIVCDTNKKPVAELVFGSYDTGNELEPKYIVTLGDGKKYPIITKCNFSTFDIDPLANRMVKLLFAKGYLKVEEF